MARNPSVTRGEVQIPGRKAGESQAEACTTILPKPTAGNEKLQPQAKALIPAVYRRHPRKHRTKPFVFIAVVASGLAEQHDWKSCPDTWKCKLATPEARLESRAAARIGSQDWPPHNQKPYNRINPHPMGILYSRSDLLDARAAWRADRKVVVFTNGCYDLLHAGHIRLLERARSLGDVLILALNSDASVARLKGPSRPLIREGERAQLPPLWNLSTLSLSSRRTPPESLSPRCCRISW
jgi:cytidyltransferase-like protein